MDFLKNNRNVVFVFLGFCWSKNFKDPDNQVSHVKDTRYPPFNDLNPALLSSHPNIGQLRDLSLMVVKSVKLGYQKLHN